MECFPVGDRQVKFEVVGDETARAEADQWLLGKSGSPTSPDMMVIVARQGGEIAGVFQLINRLVIYPYFDPEAKPRQTLQMYEGLRHWAEIQNVKPIILTHDDAKLWEIGKSLMQAWAEELRVFELCSEPIKPTV